MEEEKLGFRIGLSFESFLVGISIDKHFGIAIHLAFISIGYYW